jgi:predicted transcriptional regulator
MINFYTMLKSSSSYRHFVPRKTGDATPLGDLESALMQVVWAQEHEVSVSDVHALLPEPRRLAYTTVKTTMERLADKGILHRERDGKAYVYRAAVTQEDLERRIVSQAIDRLVEQFPVAVASFFVSPDPKLSGNRLLLLQDAIDRLKERRDG